MLSVNSHRILEKVVVVAKQMLESVVPLSVKYVPCQWETWPRLWKRPTGRGQVILLLFLSVLEGEIAFSR
jgi:hypothetical protein